VSSEKPRRSRAETATFLACFTFICASMVARVVLEEGSPWRWVFIAGSALMLVGFLVSWIRQLRRRDPFDNKSPDEKPLVEIMEPWHSPLPANAAAAAIAQSFSGSTAKIQHVGDVVRVRKGSNWRYRLRGNSPSRSGALPVALDVGATSTGESSNVQARAYDTLGWRMTDRAFAGAEKVFETRLRELLAKTAIATEAANSSVGTTRSGLPAAED
jgi:hypothetical protein